MSAQPVPFLDLVTIHRELADELTQAFHEALRSAQFIGGPEVDAFEREFAAYCGAGHCVGVSSGTDALRFALIAAGIGPGDAVITVSHTFIATVEAIGQAGAAAELVDIDERTWTMSPDALAGYLAACPEDPVSGRIRGLRSGWPITAIVPVHLYGQMAPMDPIEALAERYGLVVIEDACQAHGAVYRSERRGGWRRAGSLGRAAAFSFYPGKNLGACGEAGAVTTDDEGIARTVRMLRDHGQVQKYSHAIEGYNGRLDALQAAFLRIKLRRLDDWNAQRRAAAARYDDLLAGLGRTVPGLVLPWESETSRGVHHLYVIRVPDRDGLADHLRMHGIHTGLHYPVPVHLQDSHRAWGYQRGSLPVTERVASEVLSLPMFPGLSAGEQTRVAAAIGTFPGIGVDKLTVGHKEFV